MKEYTKIDQIKDILKRPYQKLEYFFAKRWLDRNFGKREYWGQEIMDLLIFKQEHEF
jgi:hypothetical protein